MSSRFLTQSEPGRTLFGSLRQISAAGVPGLYWDDVTEQWVASVALNNMKIPLVEGTGAFAGYYTGGTGTLGTYTGWVTKQVHDDNDADRVIGTREAWIDAGVEQAPARASHLTDLPLATWAAIESQGGVTAVNMRGTDNALLASAYTAPNNASIAAAAASASTAASQATTAATASSAGLIASQAVEGRLTTARAAKLDNIDVVLSTRSSHSAADVRTAINSGGGVTASNMRGTDNALLAANYTAANNAGIATAAADATAAKVAAEAVSARLTATRAGYLDNLSGGAVATQATVLSIATTPRLVVSGPAEAAIPASTPRVYTVELFIYDTSGAMEAPDSTPTIAAANEGGVNRSANLGAVSLVATGHYRATYTVASTHAEEQIILSWTVLEGTQTLRAAHVMTVSGTAAAAGGFTVSDRGKLDAIHAKLPSKDFLTGTAAADGDINVGQLDGDLSILKADVSGLATLTAIDDLPADIKTYLDANGGIPASNMRGTDNALLAASYTAPNNASIVSAASSAATAATQATAAATDAAAAKVAAELVSGRVTVQRASNLDNLDATVSSRSTFNHASNQVTLAAGQGVALETTSQAIKAKTDLLPSQPAAVGNIPTASQIAAQVDSTLSTSHGAGAWTAAGGDATLAKQNEILAAVGQVVPAAPSPIMVSGQRTWRLRDDGEDSIAPNIILLPAGVTVTLAMDFRELLNPGTGIALVTTVTDVSGNNLVPTDLAPSQDRTQAHMEVTGLAAGTRYELLVTVTTSDGQTLRGRGYLRAE